MRSQLSWSTYDEDLREYICEGLLLVSKTVLRRVKAVNVLLMELSGTADVRVLDRTAVLLLSEDDAENLADDLEEVGNLERLPLRERPRAAAV